MQDIDGQNLRILEYAKQLCVLTVLSYSGKNSLMPPHGSFGMLVRTIW